MDHDILLALIGLAGSSAAASLTAGLMTRFGRRADRQKGVSDAVRFLLHSTIEQRCLDCLGRGSITPDELQMLTEAHRTYHDELGGNGYLDGLMARIRSLPLTPPPGTAPPPDPAGKLSR